MQGIIPCRKSRGAWPLPAGGIKGTKKMSAAFPGILNDVIGPIMHGPSSSHTAASWRIGRYAGLVLGEPLQALSIVFDDMGAFADVFRSQRADLAFVAGALGLDIISPEYDEAYAIAEKRGVTVSFARADLAGVNHPNDLDITCRGADKQITLRAASIGGGSIEIKAVNGFSVKATAAYLDIFAVLSAETAGQAKALLDKGAAGVSISRHSSPSAQTMVHAWFLPKPDQDGHPPLSVLETLAPLSPSFLAWTPPLLLTTPGKPLFSNAAEAVAHCAKNNCSLAQAGRASEAALLGLSLDAVEELMAQRLDIMLESVTRGFNRTSGMRLLAPTAKNIFSHAAGPFCLGGPITAKAAARALAAMQENSAGGLVCAAPTAGSAGVMPGMLVTLLDDLRKSRTDCLNALWVAGVVGQCFAAAATFAAEVGGCQVEVGGAMAAAALVEVVGGSPTQVFDCASMSMQNVLGLVCDPVQGFVELPCHSRNAAATAAAFTAADLVLGGWQNPVPFDEVAAAALAVGNMLPRELRSTALGGLAACPSACSLCHK